MSENTNPFESPELQKIIKNLRSAFEIKEKLNKGFSVATKISGAYTALTTYQSIASKSFPSNTIESIIKNAETVQSILAKHKVPSAFDLISTMDKVLPVIDQKSHLPVIDWDWMSKELSAHKDYSLDNVDELLTDTIREELDNSVQATFTTENPPKNIEQRYGEWKQKHPLLADLYLSLIGFVLGILGGIITSCIPGITTKNSNVYDAPTSTSNVITNISVNQNITVVNEVPYYYEITFTHPETGAKISGYIYKPNITTSQESDEAIDVTED